MKKLTTFIALLLSTSIFALDNAEIERWKQSTWRVNITLETSSVYGNALQFAIFDNNPTREFCIRYKKLKATMDKKLTATDDPMINISNLSVSWDTLFGDIPGDQVYLLTLGNKSGLSSNEKKEKAYIVTKTVMFNQRPAVWIAPLNTTIGKEQSVKLTNSNVLYLDDIVKKVNNH
jgi:hypothetical protein